MKNLKVVLTLIATLQLFAVLPASASSQDLDNLSCDANYEHCGSNNPAKLAEIKQLQERLKLLNGELIYAYVLRTNQSSAVLSYFRSAYPNIKAELVENGIRVIAKEKDLSNEDMFRLLDRIESDVHASPTVETFVLDVKAEVKLSR